jgi:membrane protease YdiL (CAAX protease family)
MWKAKLKNIGIALILTLGWVGLIDGFLRSLNPQSLFTTLFFSCILTPLWEELLFRHIPLQTLKLISFRSEAQRLKALFLTVLLSSVIFGLVHGRGGISILIQGVCGLAFSYVYLKNSYSYWSAVILHSLYNLFWVLLSATIK